MTPPKATGNRIARDAPAAPSAVSLCLTTLKTRPEFLKAASARRLGAGSFMLQARYRDDRNPAVQVGFTASKKIGNAVMRNRAKRRLREVARAILPRMAHPGWDYVLVARPGATIERPFADLLSDLEGALRQIHRERK